MPEKSATCTYLINEPFAGALKSLRAILTGPKLRITRELDLSARIRKALQMNIPPCIVLFAEPAARTAEDLAAASFGATLTPLNIVVSARGSRTEVHFLRACPRLDGRGDQPALATLGQLQGALFQAIEKIGMRCLET